MRIYSRQDFMTLPEGVIFAKGKPWFFGTLSVKGDTIFMEGRAIDFGVRDLVNIESHDSGEWSDRLEEMLENKASYPMNDSYGRDGCFDDEDVFLVYETQDIKKLITTLQYAEEVI